ncbi:MAG TPA: efflux RND transporter permease subunit, partial [Candidatus Dormibacteraeota bacterium]|nr:efflux RND transporter permease subunit [Candidatus Dormibacteraeota bacterium]
AQHGYVTYSALLIRKMFLALALLAGFAVIAGLFGKLLPRSFLPDEDQGYFMINVQLPEAASLQRTAAAMAKIDGILKTTKGVRYANGIAGFSVLSQTASSRNGIYFCQLKPFSDRKTPELQSAVIVGAINRKLAGIIEARVFAFLPPAIPGIGQAGGVDFFIQDRSGGTVDYLWNNTQRFLAAARRRPEFAGLNLTFTPSTPQLFAAVDKDKVFKLGLSTTDVYTALQALLGGYYVNQFNRFGRVWRVFVEAEPEYRTKPSDVSLFYVRNKAGTMVPLSTVMDMRNITGPEYTTRFNEYRGIEIFALPAAGYSSGDAMNAVAELSSEVLPRDMSYSWNGISYQESIAGSGAPVFALSLIFVFLILAALYESWSLPFSVLLSVPVAVCGAFFGLWIRRFDNDVYAQIGLIMLIGLSAKNAILIVEFAKARFEKGDPLVASAIEGARLRLRPILMTSFAFIFGLLPLWNALGAGAMARRLIGTVTITGMIFSTSLAIFLVPALFVAVERLSFRVHGKTVPAASIRQLRDASAPRPEPSPGGGK